MTSRSDGSLDTLHQVIDAGAHLKAINAFGCTALMLACRVDKDVGE